MDRYLKRIVESRIERKMKSSGAVLIAGPKFCGKTTTAMQFAKSVKKLSTESSINLARIEPRAALDGEKPRLIDEWQSLFPAGDEHCACTCRSDNDSRNPFHVNVDLVSKYG